MPWIALGLIALWFTLVLGMRTLVQLRRTGDSGLRAGGLRSRVGSAEWLGAWSFVVAVGAAVAAPVAQLAGLDPLVDVVWLHLAGVAVACAGIAATFVAQLDMGRQWRIGVDPNERTELVTGGAFSLARNPIFTTIVVTGAGLTMTVPNVVAVAGFGALVGSVQVQVRLVEEPYLLTVHGDTYRAYASRVGRFVPGVGLLSSTPTSSVTGP